MKRIGIFAAGMGVLASLSCGNHGREAPLAPPPGFKELTFDATDGHKVYADFYPSASAGSKKAILMFHQAGSNAGEYETIAPKMTALGYNCIAVDQRSGGDMWGRDNRTLKNSGAGNYLEAYYDLAGALKYAEAEHYSPIIVWGSSYSASLVFKLASENPEVGAVISFSPGEYMDQRGIVKTWASHDKAPTFVACSEEELHDGRTELFGAIPALYKELFSFPGGVHGSSTLIPEKSKAADLYMNKLKRFLGNLKTK